MTSTQRQFLYEIRVENVKRISRGEVAKFLSPKLRFFMDQIARAFSIINFLWEAIPLAIGFGEIMSERISYLADTILFFIHFFL